MMSMSTSTSAARPLGGEGDGVSGVASYGGGDRTSIGINVHGNINVNINRNSSTNAGSPWLSGLLNSAKNRDTLTRLESGLVTFMLDVSKARLQLPPCSDFQRRIYVEVAKRFGLEHTLDRPPITSNASDPNAALLVLVKTAKSAIPAVMLSQQIVPDKPKLAKRPKGRGSGTADTSHGTNAAGGRPNSIKNVSQEEYEQARARIFKDARNRTENNNNNSAAGPDFPSGNSSSSDALDSLLNVRLVGGGIARGPEEGKSFARRRARMNATTSVPTTSNPANGTGAPGIASTAIMNPTTTPVAGGLVGDNGTNANVNVNGNLCSGVANLGAAMSELSVGNAGNGNGNGGGDRDDPDFDRCYDKWAVRGHQGAPQMMYPPQYQHAYHTMSAMSSLPAMATMPTMTHAQAHAQAAAAAVSAYPIVPMYHVPPPQSRAPPPPSRQMHLFAQYDSHGAHHSMAGMGTFNSGGGTYHVNGNRNGNGNRNSHGNSMGVAKVPTPTYGLDSAADFPPLGGGGTTSSATNNRSKIENQERR